MKGKTAESRPSNELQFELKYCERCGGLWLRAVGERRVYCVKCQQEMSEWPAASRVADETRAPQHRSRSVSGEFDGYDERREISLDAGGAA